MRRILIPIIASFSVAACHSGGGARPSTATTVDVNPYVIGDHGRCKVGIEMSTDALERREGLPREDALKAAMREMDQARANPAAEPASRLKHLAHEVRKAYVRWFKKYYEVSMNLTHGPYRCLSYGHPVVPLSSDGLLEKRALFAAYVDGLRAWPEPSVGG